MASLPESPCLIIFEHHLVAIFLPSSNHTFQRTGCLKFLIMVRETDSHVLATQTLFYPFCKRSP